MLLISLQIILSYYWPKLIILTSYWLSGVDRVLSGEKHRNKQKSGMFCLFVCLFVFVSSWKMPLMTAEMMVMPSQVVGTRIISVSVRANHDDGPLIGQYWSRDMNTGLWLADGSQTYHGVFVTVRNMPSIPARLPRYISDSGCCCLCGIKNTSRSTIWFLETFQHDS